MPRWRDDKPRPHHYEFAHRALPRIVLGPRADLLALAGAGRLGEALSATWAAVGERQAEPDRLPGDGLHAETVDVGGSPGVLVTLPVARHAPEAFFVLVAPLEPAESRRYLTLEFSWNVLTDQPATVVGEWRAGRHYNHGQGPDPAVSAFLGRARELISS